MKNLKLICMGFDGEFKTERPDFQTTEQAWEYSGDLGSKWYFYPFHFVVTESLKTIVAAPDRMEELVGRRLKTVVKLFATVQVLPEAVNADSEVFLALVMNYFLKQLDFPFNAE